MTPEQREQFIARRRTRAETPAEPARPAPAVAAPARGATTFDALFPPLTATESFGQAWLHIDGKLQRVRLRLGISDGQQTELIEVLDGNVQEGSEVVTSVMVGTARPTPPAAGNAFPGLGGPVFRGGGGGGRRGGG